MAKSQEKSLKCKTCEYVSKYAYHLQLHEAKHSTEKPYECRQCKFSTAHKSSFAIHQRVHSGEKPYSCSTCSYRTAHLATLVSHERLHTGETPFKCAYCSYASPQRANLFKHERIHSGDKPFKCKYCDFATAQKGNLNKHELRHIQNKFFKCGECGYSARNESALMHHVKTHCEHLQSTRTVKQKNYLREESQASRSIDQKTCSGSISHSNLTGKPHSILTSDIPDPNQQSNLTSHQDVLSAKNPRSPIIAQITTRSSQKKQLTTHHSAEKPQFADLCKYRPGPKCRKTQSTEKTESSSTSHQESHCAEKPLPSLTTQIRTRASRKARATLVVHQEIRLSENPQSACYHKIGSGPKSRTILGTQSTHKPSFTSISRHEITRTAYQTFKVLSKKAKVAKRGLAYDNTGQSSLEGYEVLVDKFNEMYANCVVALDRLPEIIYKSSTNLEAGESLRIIEMPDFVSDDLLNCLDLDSPVNEIKQELTTRDTLENEHCTVPKKVHENDYDSEEQTKSDRNVGLRIAEVYSVQENGEIRREHCKTRNDYREIKRNHDDTQREMSKRQKGNGKTEREVTVNPPEISETQPEMDETISNIIHFITYGESQEEMDVIQDASENLPGSGEDSSGACETFPETVENRSQAIGGRQKTNDEPGETSDTPVETNDEPVETNDEPGETIDEPGETIDEPGVKSDLPGVKSDLPGETIDEPGETVNEPGETVNEPGGTIDELQETSYESRDTSEEYSKTGNKNYIDGCEKQQDVVEELEVPFDDISSPLTVRVVEFAEGNSSADNFFISQ